MNGDALLAELERGGADGIVQVGWTNLAASTVRNHIQSSRVVCEKKDAGDGRYIVNNTLKKKAATTENFSSKTSDAAVAQSISTIRECPIFRRGTIKCSQSMIKCFEFACLNRWNLTWSWGSSSESYCDCATHRGEMHKFVVLSNIFHQMQRTSSFVHKGRKELDGSSLHCHMRLYVHYG